jgi:retron-type reverse transcriptase
MPKRHGQLFEKMFTQDALYKAYLSSRKRKRKKSAVYKFEKDLGANLSRLHKELQEGSYKPRPYKTFYVHDPKPRLIFAPHFRDVVVQHAMYSTLYPIMDRTFCFESFGCRLGKGTHRAADRAQEYLRKSPKDSYILQFDIRKYFYRIDRGILQSLWEKKIKDIRVLELVKIFAEYPDKTGIPIGNLLSQLGALIYLNPLDNFIKRVLKVNRYVRYVDDFILFGLSLDTAKQFRDTITLWLSKNLNLELSKWVIQPVKRGVNFVGFRTWRTTRFVRKRSMFNFNKSLKNGNLASIQSSLSHALHSASYRHFMRKIDEASLCISTQ